MQPLEIETVNPNTFGKSANPEAVALIISQYKKNHISPDNRIGQG
jgi:hypothetical protein